MTYHDEERIKKLFVWNILSFITTFIFLWQYTESKFEACFYTVLLHTVQAMVRYLFEKFWKYRESK